jgi:hypothetical protein
MTACVVGCSASSSRPPVTTDAFTGTWTGTSSKGEQLAYTFTDATFDWELVHPDTTRTRIGTGLFATDGTNIILNGTFTTEDDMVQLTVTSPAYVSGSSMCDTPLLADSTDGIAGTYTSTVSSQQYNDSGGALGPPIVATNSVELDADGTFVETTNGSQQAGTYVATDTQVTTTIQTGNVEAVRTFAIVDDGVLCDPAYSR